MLRVRRFRGLHTFSSSTSSHSPSLTEKCRRRVPPPGRTGAVHLFCETKSPRRRCARDSSSATRSGVRGWPSVSSFVCANLWASVPGVVWFSACCSSSRSRWASALACACSGVPGVAARTQAQRRSADAARRHRAPGRHPQRHPAVAPGDRDADRPLRWEGCFTKGRARADTKLDTKRAGRPRLLSGRKRYVPRPPPPRRGGPR